MNTVISESQTAFIKGRQILDGILIANEIVDEAKKEGKKGLMFKVDLEKAYDSVCWEYLEFIMTKMAFPLVWRRWIMECLSTASMSILVNGSPIEEVTLGMGLR